MAMEIAPHWHCLEEADLLQYFFPLGTGKNWLF